ncbi:uncharacterized protein [Lolium perenne]|uniref:uncharacterized protein isoform X2 n=1 Tax=Lolium perenne TaxID=4522 RepID=UPI0021F650EF|nr:uncharacterized protein LOC127312878 isoform X2 [Lolium perenne]
MAMRRVSRLLPRAPTRPLHAPLLNYGQMCSRLRRLGATNADEAAQAATQVGHIGRPATAGADLDTVTTMEVTPPALLPLPSAQIWPSASDISQRTMAKSSARKETAPARPPATLPQQHMFPGAPSSSSANPSTPQHLYPHGSSYTNPLNQWARGEEQKQ